MVSINEFCEKRYDHQMSWPFRPSGTLIKPSREPSGVNKITDKGQMEFEYYNQFVNNFIQSRLNHITWILAAVIGVLGNLVVSFAFSTPNVTPLNNIVTIFGVLLIIFIIIGLLYIEPMKFMFSFLPDYLSFPKGYAKYVDINSLENVKAKINVQFDVVDEYVANFGNLVLLIILRDHLKEALKDVKYLKIVDIKSLSQFSVSLHITISTKLRALIFPVSRETIVREFMTLMGSITRCRILCSVLAFETDEEEWKKYGANFLDTVVDWDFRLKTSEIISEIKGF
jgi:hypothetical protein